MDGIMLINRLDVCKGMLYGIELHCFRVQLAWLKLPKDREVQTLTLINFSFCMNVKEAVAGRKEKINPLFKIQPFKSVALLLF